MTFQRNCYSDDQNQKFDEKILETYKKKPQKHSLK